MYNRDNIIFGTFYSSLSLSLSHSQSINQFWICLRPCFGSGAWSPYSDRGRPDSLPDQFTGICNAQSGN